MLGKLRYNKKRLQRRQTLPPRLLRSLQVDTCAASTMTQSYPSCSPRCTGSSITVTGRLTIQYPLRCRSS